MEYILSTETFYENLFVNNRTRFHHQPGKRFNLFPFVGNNNTVPVTDLSKLLGQYLCEINDEYAEVLSVDELCNLIKEDTEIQVGQEKVFKEVIAHIFYEKDGSPRPLNLQMIMQLQCENTQEKKLADYLVDVLGDNEILKEELKYALIRSQKDGNVLEKEMISKIVFNKRDYKNKKNRKYFRLTDSLHECFERDFKYIIENPRRIREYLVSLLEIYYFSYTAQTCLQLNRFLYGERDRNIPIYFCLDWEKTNQNRPCFTEGWQQLQESIKKIFAHAIVLEILNQTEENTPMIDYISLQQMINENPEMDFSIANQISNLTDCYREAITDCPDMSELQRVDTDIMGNTEAEIKYLFNSIKMQFELKRNRPYTAYASQFEKYCDKFLKSRGRSGKMLTISEELLIFLTKISIKDQEKMRLNDVFKEFEKRGIFVDDVSKEAIATYYEKLNLIEKKSDSGDAKYVKRIL